MADLFSFALYDNTGTPLTGVVPLFLAYKTRDGSNVTKPNLFELGGGLYGFNPADADAGLGIVFLIDAGGTASVQYYSGTLSTEDDPFAAFHLVDANGALYAGAGSPAFASYKDATGANRSAPIIATLLSNYLFTFTPTAADLLVDIAWELASPTGSYPERLYGYFYGIADAAPGPSSVDLRSVLIADAGVALLVGVKVYPSLAPQDALPPFIVYQVISDVPENTFTGDASTDITNSRVQVDSYSKTYLDAHAIDAAVDAVISALSSPTLAAWREVSRDLYDNDSKLYRVSSEFSLFK